MKEKDFTKNRRKEVPNSRKKTVKEETALIRISKEAQEIAKNYAFINDTTIKSYVESLIFHDEKKRNLEI